MLLIKWDIIFYYVRFYPILRLYMTLNPMCGSFLGKYGLYCPIMKSELEVIFEVSHAR